MRRKMFSLIAVAAVTMLTLAGCGSNRDSSGSVTGDADDVLATAQAVGVTNCVKCHSTATPETLSWLSGTHGNSNGNLRYDDPRGPHAEGSSCQPCHNQLLDGDKLGEAFPPGLDIGDGLDDNDNVIDIYANVSRDIVTCESCHGGGEFHSGVGPIPYVRPDWEQCVACHDHPEGVRHADSFGMLASNVGASAHNNADDLHASTTRCQRCHTVEGSIQLAQYTGDSDVMHLMDDLDPIDLEENLHPVTCSACHVPHTDELRADTFIALDYTLNEDTVDEQAYAGNWDPNGNAEADQFDFCTSCHVYKNQDGTLIGSGSVDSGTAPFYHNTAWYRILPSTHYDDPDTGYGLPVSQVEGYVIRENSANPCFDCHGHELRTNTHYSREEAEDGDNPLDFGYTIHTEWASSGHAGGLLNTKYAAADENPVTLSRGDDGYEEQGMAQVDAVMAAGASDDSSNGGFTHYNWDSTFESDGVTSDRGDCQMCHTATGFVNYVADPVAYDIANNDFSHLSGWNAIGGSPQNEMLYCWGCHDNAQTGTLRVEGAVTATYTFGGEAVVFPDSGNSNTCIVCHSGRGNNEVVSTSSRFAGHHAPAAATLFNELSHVAYEFDVDNDPTTNDYANVAYFAHDAIGADGAGPCVSCHMDSSNHEFAVVEKDSEGVISGITSSICVSCHDGEHALFVAQGQVGETVNIWNGTAAVPTVVTQAMADEAAAELEHEAEGYQAAGTLLLDLINQTNGLTNYTNAVINQSNVPDNDKGAFQNSKLISDEKGGFAHNRYYVKRAIFDAIDWVEDGAINGTITDRTATYPAAMGWLGTTRP